VGWLSQKGVRHEWCVLGSMEGGGGTISGCMWDRVDRVERNHWERNKMLPS